MCKRGDRDFSAREAIIVSENEVEKVGDDYDDDV